MKCHCAMLRRASRALTNLYDEALSPVGLTVAQYALLNGFARLGAVNISEAARALQLDRTTLGRNVTPLAQAGLIELLEGHKDARERQIRLTDAGRRAMRRAKPRWEQAQARILSRLGPEKLQTLHALLAEIEFVNPA